jgi:hypothetical protein
MGLRKLFKTDEKVEQQGVWLDYGDTRIRIARAGGANKKFAKVLDKKTKPYRRALASGTMDNDRANNILRETYAESVVLDWQTKVGDEWKPGIDPEDAGLPAGDLLPVNSDNVLLALTALPDLYQDIMSQAQSIALFRAELDEAAAGN